ncbi:MAG: hypothetical protein PHS96_07975 [Anaerolineales bacterium]|nr:hypothetical protein [Anaerolineales bacterium]
MIEKSNLDAAGAPQPGMIALFGSGETSASGRKIFDLLFRRMPPSPRVAVLETPAGFELNSAQVAGRVADFLGQRFQNPSPRVQVIPARKRGTPFSPDAEGIVAPLLRADMIFMGPGSPSYAVRQLRHSLAWEYLIARHRLGGCLVFASAALIAIGAYALPVYEIFKVGEEPNWKAGLDFFQPFGLPLVFIPHWNNQDGGESLDTSRCFMGVERFEGLAARLPAGMTIVGVEEKTALLIDLQAEICQVTGKGGVVLLPSGESDAGAVNRQAAGSRYPSGATFPLGALGPYRCPLPEEGLSPTTWQRALQAAAPASDIPTPPPPEVMSLVVARSAARRQGAWGEADRLREQIEALGWEVRDTAGGPELVRRGGTA